MVARAVGRASGAAGGAGRGGTGRGGSGAGGSGTGGSGAGGGGAGGGGGPAVIAVRVRPGAANTRVGGGHQGRYGPALVVAVGAPAVDGRATEVARRAVAGALGLRASDVTVRAGRTSRDKLFEVAAPPADLADRVRALRDS